MHPRLPQRLLYAIFLARLGGDVTLDFFQNTDLTIEIKADGSFITKADRSAEKLMRSELSIKFPNDSIMGEEFGYHEGDSGWTWYLDPIDGTEAFVRGVPLYGTLVSCSRDDRGEIGVIYLPALSEIVFASKNRGAWWANRVPNLSKDPRFSVPVNKATVSRVSNAADACLITTHNEWWDKVGKSDLLSDLLSFFGIHRMWGHCYGPAMVATGRADVFVEPSGHDWDFASPKVIVEEAGGKVTSIHGIETFQGGNIVATNGLLHNATLDLLKSF